MPGTICQSRGNGPSIAVISHLPGRSTPAKLGRTPCGVISLRPSTSAQETDRRYREATEKASFQTTVPKFIISGAVCVSADEAGIQRGGGEHWFVCVHHWLI